MDGWMDGWMEAAMQEYEEEPNDVRRGICRK
jgi:hypothetical protein